MKKLFKSTVITGVIVVFGFVMTNNVFAQNRPPQNVRRVIVTSKYEIKDGKRTGKSMAIKQEIKDSLDRIHTILFRDYNTQEVTSHIWRYFDGKQVVRTDDFSKGLLRFIHEYKYTPDSLLSVETIYRVNPGDTALYFTLNYKYGTNRKPIQIDALDIKGKKVYRVKSTYNNKGGEILRKVKVKKGFSPLDSIVNFTNVIVYDSLGNKASEKITEKYLNGKSSNQAFRYTYNKKGLLASLEELDNSGAVIYRKEFEYNDKGMLKFISVYNPQKVLTEYYALRYELYPTKDRRNQIIEY